jgi:hypothetical protein
MPYSPIGGASKLVAATARFCPGENPESLVAVNKLALESLACHYLRLSEEITSLEEQIARLVSKELIKIPTSLAYPGAVFIRMLC